MTANSYSVVEYYSCQTNRECGYCNGANSNCSHGMWAHYLTVQDYQSLIDRGWRRSGSYCYKPIMDQTCCPMYTIRCDALDFKITKSQKKILKRMAKFLRNELQRDAAMEESKNDTTDNIDIRRSEFSNYAEHSLKAEKNISEMKVTSTENKVTDTESKVESRLQLCTSETPVQKRVNKRENETTEKSPSPSKNSTLSIGSSREKNTARGAGLDPNRTPPKKAKLIRAERKQNKLLAQGKSPEEIATLLKSNQQNVAKDVEDLYNDIHGGVKKLETKLVRVMSDEFFETLDASAKLYQKYQMAIHDNTPSECDRKSFLNFLVKSPLQPHSPPNGPPHGYGSFHEQYWLDGVMIAVAVIDILPFCVSSVYFFYDPDFAFLSLGTFSSLREVCLTRQLNKVAPSIKYYYMGFYIHSKVKMRYKAKIKPSKLLCPETYVWCDIDRAVEKIDKEKYSRLTDDIDAIDEDGIVDLEKVMVLYRRTAITYGMYKNRNDEEDAIVKEYATLIGMKCARSILLYRQ